MVSQLVKGHTASAPLRSEWRSSPVVLSWWHFDNVCRHLGLSQLGYTNAIQWVAASMREQPTVHRTVPRNKERSSLKCHENAGCGIVHSPAYRCVHWSECHLRVYINWPRFSLGFSKLNFSKADVGSKVTNLSYHTGQIQGSPQPSGQQSC